MPGGGTRLAALRSWLRSGIIRSIGVLVGGTALAHGITAVAMPISTRLFTPADFSAAAAFASIVGILVVAACLRFDMAIALPEDDDEAINLLALSAASAIAVTLVVALALVVLPSTVLAGLRQPSLLPHLWLLPIAVLIGAMYLALQMWFVRRKRFGAIARSRVVQSAAAAGGQIGLGALGHAPLGLIVGQLLNYGAASVILGWRVLIEERALLKRVSLTGMVAAFRTHQRFPRYSVWEALANAAAIHAPILLIAALAVGPEAGYLTLAIFLLQAPMALLGHAVGQVYLSGAPEALREGRLAAYTMDILSGLLRSALAPLLFLAIVSPWAFEWVFGTGWARAGVLVSWMAPWFLLQFVSSPISSALHVTGRQRTAMALQIFGLVLRVGSVALAGLAHPRFVAEVYAVSGALFYGLYMVVVIGSVGGRVGELGDALRKAAPSAFLTAIVGIAVVAALARLH
ncbi:lipopolysaccharide biosynthesis protein [Sphingosinicella sp. LY1275]|uniref:lipopolysaccharide biosynthesis protein n=1 Tax=Sphingosinicella sp. LY1275 TaxID=3095379 RepID=UPI002ADEB92B|nr:oligosaccharide flippase family protein [Sphingosinicella sp. LY1275]MEA1014477.1 oligosaccharide flippase family protein [Sphingosinicella sp. LY1275]